MLSRMLMVSSDIIGISNITNLSSEDVIKIIYQLKNANLVSVSGIKKIINKEIV